MKKYCPKCDADFSIHEIELDARGNLRIDIPREEALTVIKFGVTQYTKIKITAMLKRKKWGYVLILEKELP